MVSSYRACAYPGFYLGRQSLGRCAGSTDCRAAPIVGGLASDVRHSWCGGRCVGDLLEGPVSGQAAINSRNSGARECSVGSTVPATTTLADLRHVLVLCLGFLVLLFLVSGLPGEGRRFHRSADGHLLSTAVSSGCGRQHSGWLSK